MSKRRIRIGRSVFAACLSLIAFLSVVWIGGDVLLGDAWHTYIIGEAAVRLRLPSAGSDAVSVVVPDLSAQPFSVDMLDENLFGLSVTYTQNQAPPRTVLTQFPAPGSTRKAVPGKIRVPVSVTVSTGPRTAVVPEVCGTEGRQAKITLRQAGFTVRVIPLTQEGACGLVSPEGERFRYVPRGTFTAPVPGTAVFTEPGCGCELEAGAEIVLYLAAEHPTESPVCPDMVGMTLTEAEKALSGAGIRVGNVTVITDTAAASTVIEQSRLAGTRLSPDDSVDLTVAEPTPQRKHFWDYWPFTISKG